VSEAARLSIGRLGRKEEGDTRTKGGFVRSRVIHTGMTRGRSQYRDAAVKAWGESGLVSLGEK